MQDEPLSALIAQHGVGLPGGGLPVHEDGRVAALEELLDHLAAALVVDLLVGLRVLEYVVEGELVDVVHLDLALLAEEGGGLLPEDVAVVAGGLAAGEGGDLAGVLVDDPGLDVLVLVDEGAHPHGHLDPLVFLHNDIIRRQSLIWHLKYF